MPAPTSTRMMQAIKAKVIPLLRNFFGAGTGEGRDTGNEGDCTGTVDSGDSCPGDRKPSVGTNAEARFVCAMVLASALLSASGGSGKADGATSWEEEEIISGNELVG